MTAAPPRFRESAAVVLVRERAGALAVFWARRSDVLAFMPGFYGFIGGSVAAEDQDLPLAGVADPRERALKACAIREAFEETGVLPGLTQPAAPDVLVRARDRLLAGEASFPALAREHGWSFDASALAFAGRWTTPPFAVARFETTYFLAEPPEGQEPRVRPGELAEGEWIAPDVALDRWRAGEATFAAPILHTLRAIAEGREGLAERLATAPERAGQPVRRIELEWGIVLQPMKTRPLPPATHTNAYLVGEREMALIDPGSGEPGELEALFTLIERLAADGRRLVLALVTHHHPDHVGGLAAVRERHRIPVGGHAATGAHVPLDRVLHDGETVALAAGPAGPWDLTALHTPGHAQGHLCFLHARTGALFTGDHVTGGSGTVIIDPPEGDMAAYLASLERLLGLQVRTLFPAHGSPQGAAKRRIQALIDHRLGREAKVLAALGPDPRTLTDLIPVAYADTKQELWPYAERSLLAHLLKLEGEGKATRTGSGWLRKGPRQ